MRKMDEGQFLTSLFPRFLLAFNCWKMKENKASTNEAPLIFGISTSRKLTLRQFLETICQDRQYHGHCLKIVWFHIFPYNSLKISWLCNRNQWICEAIRLPVVFPLFVVYRKLGKNTGGFAGYLSTIHEIAVSEIGYPLENFLVNHQST